MDGGGEEMEEGKGEVRREGGGKFIDELYRKQLSHTYIFWYYIIIIQQIVQPRQPCRTVEESRKNPRENDCLPTTFNVTGCPSNCEEIF